MIKVAKFGGSSVSSAKQFSKVKNIVLSDPSRRIVVISAAGKRDPNDHKLTDLLYLCHAHLTYGVSCDDIFDKICERFIEIRDELGLTYKIEDELDILRARLNKDMSIDELVSRGEYLTSRLMAEYLGYTFLDATECIFMEYDGTFIASKIANAVKSALERLDANADSNGCESANGVESANVRESAKGGGRSKESKSQKACGLVIPGFYGALPSGKIRIMSRGGSDITGALVAAGCNANLYENWTDVSGILMADPRIVPNPSPIAQITYAELRELAYMGASVLHEDSIAPVKDLGIALNIRNTNEPDHPGTMIVDKVDEKNLEHDRFITGIAGKKNFVILTVSKRMHGTNETLRKVLEILDHYKVHAEHITMGIDQFALVLQQSSLEDRIYDIVSEIKNQCSPEDVEVQDNIALVAAVGRKMIFRPGISGKVFNALGNEGINIRTIAQGSDELAIIVGVDNSQFENTVRVLYQGFAG